MNHPATQLTPPAAFPILTPERASVLGDSDHPVMDATRQPVTLHPLFTRSTQRDDLVSAYPDLERGCAQLGFSAGMNMEQWCAAPEWALLILARAARPPQPVPLLDPSLTSITLLIHHLLEYHHRPLRNELRRVGTLIRDFAYRHPGSLSVGLDRSFRQIEINVTGRLDFEEIAIFPDYLALAAEGGGHDFGRNDAPDVAVGIHAMTVNNDQISHDVTQVQSQVQMLLCQIDDPDLTIINTGLVAISKDLPVHATTELDLLAPAVLFEKQQKYVQPEPSYGFDESMVNWAR